MTPWTESYMNVISRANLFARAWDEYRGNEDFTRELGKERRKLEMALAIYRVERSHRDKRSR